MDAYNRVNIINAHTGVLEKIDRYSFKSLNTFKAWIENEYGIISGSSILLTPFGIKLTSNMLDDVTEVFAFDRSLFNQTNYVADSEIDTIFKPRESSLTQMASSNLTSRQVFTALNTNCGWAQAILADSILFNDRITKKMSEISYLFKSLSILFQYFNLFCKDIERSFDSGLEYVSVLQSKSLVDTWATFFKQLKMIRYNNIVLSEPLDEKELIKNAEISAVNFPMVNDYFKTMKSDVQGVAKDKVNIDKQIENLRNDSIKKFKNANPQAFLSNLTSTVSKVQEDVNNLSFSTEKDLYDNETLVKQMFSTHRNDYSKSINSDSFELYTLLLSLCQFKQMLQQSSIQIYNAVALAQMRMVKVKSILKESKKCIDIIQASEKVLSLTVDMPLLYGLYIAEYIRRNEWLKGMKHLAGVSAENFAQLTDKETKYRETWFKRLGHICKMVQDDELIKENTPTIDLTILNLNYKGDSFLGYNRSDLERYIETLKRASIKVDTIQVLEKALLDLETKRSNFQSVNVMQVTEESELVKGYQSRIKKLESLLHQAQYRNLNLWPSNPVGNNQFSLFVDPNSPKQSQPAQLRSMSNGNEENISSRDISPPMEPSIDKHLDNIRLKKTVQEKDNKINLLATTTKTIQEELDLLKSKYDILKEGKEEEVRVKSDTEARALESEKESWKLSMDAKDREIELLKQSLQARDSNISQLKKDMSYQMEAYETELENSAIRISNLETSNSSLSESVEKYRTANDDLVSMKRDLLNNMASKESEFALERKNMNEEIQDLQLKLEQYEEVEETVETLKNHFVNHKRKTERLVGDLNSALQSLARRTKDMSVYAVSQIIDMCLILESIGLLLVKEDKGDIKIIRVKGLRTKSRDQQESGNWIERPNSTVINQIEDTLNWLETDKAASIIPDGSNNAVIGSSSAGSSFKSEIDEVEDDLFKESGRLLHIYGNENSENTFSSFLQSISFEDKLFVQAISKRFKDVENLAKRLQKENKSSKDELSNISKDFETKISIRDFKVNDLVLFLPTRDATDEVDIGTNEHKQPWAAFNIGAPHFFLRSAQNYDLSNRDWMLARIVSINEYHVTKENFQSSENPFSLSLGVTWYSVDAIEETLDQI